MSTPSLVDMMTFIRIVLCLFVASAAYAKMSPQAIADELGEIQNLGGDHLGYAGFILEFLGKAKNITPRTYKPPKYRWSSWRSRRRDVDMVALLSGGLAIRESLQLHSISQSKRAERNLNIDKLHGPKVKSHDYPHMLKGRTFKTFSLSKYCPKDFYYAHFSNMGRALDFFDYLTDVGGSVYQRFSPTAIDYGLKDRLLTQLALQENKKARIFYDNVISQMAVIGSDPFVLHGTDITILYKLKFPRIFALTIALYRSNFKKRYGATEKTLSIEGWRVELLSSADRRVHSFYLKLDQNNVMISNSRPAVEKLLRAKKKPALSLAESGDYKYMRSIYPADENTEDAFIFFSDAFIRHLVSPQLRIKASRRLREGERMATLEKYLLYYYQLKGRRAASMSELLGVLSSEKLNPAQQQSLDAVKQHEIFSVVERRLTKRFYSWSNMRSRLAVELQRHPTYRGISYESRKKLSKDFIEKLKDAYLAIKGTVAPNANTALDILNNFDDTGLKRQFSGLRFDKNSFKVRSEYGIIGLMKPLLEFQIVKVSEEEAEAYRRFLKSYNNFWRDYFDPIGVRINMTQSGIRVETCILPLINNSIYNRVASLLGGRPVSLAASDTLPNEVFSVAFKLNKGLLLGAGQQYIEKELSKVYPELREVKLTELIGDQVALHVLDSRPLVDFDGRMLFGEIIGRRPRMESIAGAALVWSLFHPIRVSVTLKDAKKIRRLLDLVERDFNKIYRRMNHYSTLDHYTQNIAGVKVGTVKINFFRTVTFRVYYAIVDNKFHLTSTEGYLKQLIRVRLKHNDADMAKGNVILVYRPKAMKAERDLFRTNLVEAAKTASLSNFGTYRLLHGLFPQSKNLEFQSMRQFGFKPVCPAGGSYSIDKKTKEVHNTVFGTAQRPTINIRAFDYDSINRFMGTKHIKVMLEFTDVGIKSVIETK